MKYLVSLLLLFCGLSAFSQADTIFVLGAEFGATTEPTDSTFTVDIIHPTDQLGQAFTASKIQVGYRLIDVFGRLYRVKSVDATGIGSSTLTVVELQNSNAPSGTGLVYRKPDNSDCIPEIQTGDIGISYALAARVANHNAVNGCGGGGAGDVTTSILADSMLVVRDSLAAIRGDVGTGGGGGDVTGPASSTDNAIARFDGTTGKLIQNSTVTIDDSGNTNIPGNITGGMRFAGTGSIKIGNTLSAFETNTSDGFFYHTASGGTYPFDRTSNLVVQARRSSSKDIVFVTGSTPTVRMNIQGSNGFVGIGTSTPIERLDVSGNLKVSGTISTAGFLNTVSFGGTGHLAISVLNSSFQTGLGGPVVYGTAAGGTYPFDNNANLVIQARDVIGRDIIFATGQTTPKSRVIVSDEGLAVGETKATYSLDVNTPAAALRLNPHDVTLTGAEGLLYADLSEKTFKGHNGTSFFRFMQQSTTIPTNGQIPVWNSTTGLYEPATATPAQTPAPSSTADSIGNAGDIRYDDDYIYIKTSAGWKRSALSTF